VYANDFSGETLQTTACSQADGWDKVQDYLAGIKSEKAAALTSTRSSARHKDKPVKSYAKAKRQSDKYVAGPGRGIHDRVKTINDATKGLHSNIHDVLTLHDDAFDVVTQDAAWMICKVRSACETWDKANQYLWMGWVQPGDEVVWVQKLEGIGSTFALTDKEFPVFIEDIRLSKFKMERVKTRLSQRAPHARGIERFQLPSITKANIIGSMPMTLDKHTKAHVRSTYHYVND
jgi:hypothetical protein